MCLGRKTPPAGAQSGWARPGGVETLGGVHPQSSTRRAGKPAAPGPAHPGAGGRLRRGAGPGKGPPGAPEGMGRLLAWLRSLFAPAPAGPPAPPPGDPGDPGATAEVVALVNAARAPRGRPPLRMEPRLTAAARGHAAAMAARGLLAHRGADGSTAADRVARQGYAWSAVGEAIGEGYPTAAAMVAGWMADPPHRAVLLGPYAEIGVGTAPDASGSTYWCADLAAPARPA